MSSVSGARVEMSSMEGTMRGFDHAVSVWRFESACRYTVDYTEISFAACFTCCPKRPRSSSIV